MTDKDGDLVLITHVLSFDEPVNPVLLFAKDGNSIYLRRAKGDIYELTEVAPDIVESLRKARTAYSTEVLNGKVMHAYAMPVDLLNGGDFFNAKS